MKLPRAGVRGLAITLRVVGSGVAGYLVLISPGSFWVRWAEAACPVRITMISFGPCPTTRELQQFRRQGGRYVASLLDPRLPYEKELIHREEVVAKKDGLVFKDFPMASIFGHQVFPDYPNQEQKAVDFLKHLDAPAYVHCYLGKHRVIHVRDALRRAGVPASYWTPMGSETAYWDLVSRLADARKAFGRGDYAQVLEILEPLKTEDVAVAYLRGWSDYRLGLYSQAAEGFEQGLKVDPLNPSDLEGLGFCDLQQGNPVLAQRQFSAALQGDPEDKEALVGQGLAFLRLQNKVAAERVFRQVLGTDPGDTEVEGYLKRAEAE
jgi:tetratricopeptide (TPR) repeat protein